MSVVIGILAIFSTLLITVINPSEQLKKAADAQRKNDLSQIQKAFEAYYQDFGKYPESSAGYKIMYNAVALEWGTTAWAPYMGRLPKDPKSSQTYVYVTAGNQSYRLYASLERGGKDPQACNPDGNPATNDRCTNVPGVVTCGTASQVCNYGVSSSNVSP